MANDKDIRDQPAPPTEPPRPHGDKLDDEIGAKRTGDMDLPEMNPTDEDEPDRG